MSPDGLAAVSTAMILAPIMPARVSTAIDVSISAFESAALEAVVKAGRDSVTAVERRSVTVAFHAVSIGVVSARAGRGAVCVRRRLLIETAAVSADAHAYAD